MRLKLTPTFIALIGFLGIGTLVTGYCININTLRQVLIDREQARTAQVVTTVKALFEARIHHAEEHAEHVLQAHDVSKYLAGEPAGQNSRKLSEEPFYAASLQQEAESEFMGLTDARGKVLYSAGMTSRELNRMRGLDAALQGRRMTVAAKTADGWAVVVMTPIFAGTGVVGTCSTGFRIDDRLVGELSELTQTKIALVDMQGVVAGNVGKQTLQDLGITEGAFWRRLAEGEQPVFVEEPGLQQLLMLAAFPVVDETLCIVAKTDIAPVFQLMAKKSSALTRLLLVVLAAVLSIGAFFTHLFIRPLIRLQGRAIRIASHYSPDADTADLKGNEILQLVIAFDAMSEAVKASDVRRDRSESALRESEAKYRRLFETAFDGIAVYHPDGTLADINPMGCKIFKVEKNQVVGKDLRSYMSADNHERFLKFLQSNQANRQVHGEYQACRADGTCFDIEWYCKHYVQNGTEQFIAGFRDITERKEMALEKQKLRDQAARAHKMEALGLLAGGVAHDLNNILSGVVNYPELLMNKPGLDDFQRRALTAIKGCGDRAAAVVNDLLTIARGAATATEPVNLQDLVHTFRNSVEVHSLSKRHPAITFDLSAQSDLLPIKASPIHLTKVLLNLAANAAEAIPEGEMEGEVKITVTNTHLDRAVRGYETVKRGAYVRLSVQDSGSGIALEDLDRIFEPFYSRKAMGRSGTGLGLAIVWNVVQDHGGYIDVNSTHQGTRFDLYFPVYEGRPTPASRQPVKTEQLKGDGQHVLVVDDTEMQRDIACTILSHLGYQAVAVACGEAAVEHLKGHPADLVMLDMIMDPGINGLETYRRIIRDNPRQRAIIVSGHAATCDVEAALQHGVGQFLKKPYDIETLAMAVKEELTKP